MGLRWVISGSIIHMNLHKPSNKLVNVWLGHFWYPDKPQTYTNSQYSPGPKLGESHHLPPYRIFYAWPQGLHSNVILSQDSQVGSPEILEIGTSLTLEVHNFFLDLRLKWGLKQSCNLCWELSNDMWYTTYTQVNQSDSWLLMFGNQIASLTLGPSFGHNLCFKYSFGMCKPILDI